MNRLGAVLDTNVWLDWLVFADPGVAALRAAFAAGRLQMFGLERSRDELTCVLAREAVRKQARAARQRRGLIPEPPEHSAVLAEYDATVTLLAPPQPCALVCRDPDDQCFIDLAVEARARWLISKDRALLALARPAARRFGLSIVTPHGFLEHRAGTPASL